MLIIERNGSILAQQELEQECARETRLWMYFLFLWLTLLMLLLLLRAIL